MMAATSPSPDLIDPATELRRLQQRRSRANLGWKLLGFLGILFLIEVPLPPIPPALAFIAMLLSFVGAGFLFVHAKKLPLREALLIARQHNGRLTKALLCTEINMDLATAEAVLRTLEKRNILQLDPDAFANNNEFIYCVKGFLLPEGDEHPPQP